MEDNDLFNSIQSSVEVWKDKYVVNGESDKIGTGLGGAVAVASLAGGEACFAAAVGAELAAATGIAAIGASVAVPVIALGLGYLTYKATGKFARFAIREISQKLDEKYKQ